MSKHDELSQPQIIGLLKHLGIQKAHFAARLSTDCKTLVENYSESMGSLTMLCPRPSDFRSVSTAAVNRCLECDSLPQKHIPVIRMHCWLKSVRCNFPYMGSWTVRLSL